MFRPPDAPHPGCPLCSGAGGVPVHEGERLRVIRAEDADHPAFYRVVWRAHVAEFSDLSEAERAVCMDAVVAVERVLREALSPAKVNLAAFGNRVPHLHWHVTARFEWDRHFPEPVWGPPQREVEGGAERRLGVGLDALDVRVRQALVRSGS